MSRSTVLVTGGAGFVGSALVEKLSKVNEFHDFDIIVVDKGLFGLDHLVPANDRVKVIKQSLRSFCKVFTEFNKIKTIIHLSGLSNDPLSDYDPVANHKLNYEDTKLIAEKAAIYGIPRFVFASSASIYGINDDQIMTETSTVNPLSNYSKSKYMAENFIMGLTRTNPDFKPIILRKGTIMGVSPRMRFDLVVNTMMLSAITKDKISLIGGGETWRPLVSIEDVANVYEMLIMTNDNNYFKNASQIYNIVHENYRISELALRIINQYFNIPIKLDTGYTKPRDVRSYKISGEKFKNAFGTICGVDLMTTCAKIDDWINKQTGNLNDPIYYNIQWLKICNKVCKDYEVEWDIAK